MHKKLLEFGYLGLRCKNGKIFFSPTIKGENIDISLETRKSVKEQYNVNIYNENAVKIIQELVK